MLARTRRGNEDADGDDEETTTTVEVRNCVVRELSMYVKWARGKGEGVLA